MASHRLRHHKGLKMRVLLDTNLLLLPHRHKVDVFAEIERLMIGKHTVCTFSTVLDELKALVDSTEDGVAAKVGLELVGGRGVEVIPSSGDVDSAILEYAKNHDVIVATNDRELKRKLKEVGVKVIYMRGRSHLDMT